MSSVTLNKLSSSQLKPRPTAACTWDKPSTAVKLALPSLYMTHLLILRKTSAKAKLSTLGSLLVTRTWLLIIWDQLMAFFTSILSMLMPARVKNSKWVCNTGRVAKTRKVATQAPTFSDQVGTPKFGIPFFTLKSALSSPSNAKLRIRWPLPSLELITSKVMPWLLSSSTIWALLSTTLLCLDCRLRPALILRVTRSLLCLSLRQSRTTKLSTLTRTVSTCKRES